MKNIILKISLSLIFVALFNGLFFLIGGTDHVLSVWISYGFIHAAYLILLIAIFAGKTKRGLAVNSYSLYSTATTYFVLELIAGIIFIILALESPIWPIVIQSTMLAIFLVVQIALMMANSSTAESIQKQKEESIYIQTIVSKLACCMREVSDPDIKKKVERAYNAVSNCPLESFPEAHDAELRLRNAVEILCEAIEDNADAETITKFAREVTFAVQDRNIAIRNCR